MEVAHLITLIIKTLQNGRKNDIKSTNQNAEFVCMYIVQCIVLNLESESLTSQVRLGEFCDLGL